MSQVSCGVQHCKDVLLGRVSGVLALCWRVGNDDCLSIWGLLPHFSDLHGLKLGLLSHPRATHWAAVYREEQLFMLTVC